MGKHLGEFESLLLSALVRLGPSAYGITMQREIERRAKRTVSLGALYATLARLEEKGLVTSWLGEATAERGGRAKRHYQITAEGRARLERSLTAITRMAEGIVPVAKWKAGR